MIFRVFPLSLSWHVELAAGAGIDPGTSVLYLVDTTKSLGHGGEHLKIPPAIDTNTFCGGGNTRPFFTKSVPFEAVPSAQDCAGQTLLSIG